VRLVKYGDDNLVSRSQARRLLARIDRFKLVMLDEERVIVAKGEERLIAAFKKWGFMPIECPFYDFETIGGGFHCASVDIRRRGSLQSNL
jgi:glycine amidinotransferase